MRQRFYGENKLLVKFINEPQSMEVKTIDYFQTMLIVLSTFFVLGIAGFIFYIIYYTSRGTHILMQNMDYKLKARMYGESDKQKTKPAIIFLSGWNPGKLSWTTSDFYAGFISKRMNFICLTVALRGMGSDGNINNLKRSDFLNDSIMAYDFLSGIEGVDKSQINLVGESFGGYLACILTSKRLVKKLTLRVPTDFPDKGFADTPQIKFAGLLTQEWKMQKHLYSDSYALDALHNYKGNILIVSSEKDEFIPLQTIENYLCAAKDPLKIEYQVMKGAGHALLNPFRQWKYLKSIGRFNSDLS